MQKPRVSSVPGPSDLLTTPVAPMLAKVADALPTEGDWLYEPKWDGFRAIVFRRGREAFIQSREGKPLDRYFPELQQTLAEALPPNCVIDGEIVIATSDGLDFDALLRRIHPAASRVAHLAKIQPSSFVAFDLLVAGRKSVMVQPQQQRRAMLERLLARVRPPVHLTPMTRDAAVAEQWLQRFEGAGLDGVIAKPAAAVYQPGKRAMFKIKHVRSADCVVAGFRWHKSMRSGGDAPGHAADNTGAPPAGGPPAVGSLLLGLYDSAGALQHVGVTSSFTMEQRHALAEELEPLRRDALRGHPWAGDAEIAPPAASAENAPGDAAGVDGPAQRKPGERTRWSADKNLSWEPLRPERACEVGYDHLQGDRFRHATTFLRWRPDKSASECRYDQLQTAAPFELKEVFGAGKR